MRNLFTSPILRAGAMLLLGAALIMPVHQATAQTSVLCFSQPGITNCLSGRFLQFWQQNGGLDVFGFPKTAQGPEQTPDGPRTTQYLERQRFEVANNPPPYDVLLGRLGDELLRRQGIDWTTLPKAAPNAPNYFPETGHAVPQQFYDYWLRNGLRDPALNAYQQSLALFGLPLTEATQATNSSGDTVLTQWFERARFEYHPNNPDPFKVQLGLLGNEWLAAPPPQQFTISITSPAPGSSVGNPFTATGTTTVLPNDSVLSYQVFDAANTLIGQGVFGVSPSGSGSQWSAPISFSSPASSQAIRLVVFAPSAEGPPEATASIALNFNASPSGGQTITVTQPLPGTLVARTFQAIGRTTQFPPNGVLTWGVVDNGGQLLGSGSIAVLPAQNGGTWAAAIAFSGGNPGTPVTFEVVQPGSGPGQPPVARVSVQLQCCQ